LTATTAVSRAAEKASRSPERVGGGVDDHEDDRDHDHDHDHVRGWLLVGETGDLIGWSSWISSVASVRRPSAARPRAAKPTSS
jgi:hypothetical protein